MKSEYPLLYRIPGIPQIHPAVLTVIDAAIHYCKGEVLHIRICRDVPGQLLFRIRYQLKILHLGMDIVYGITYRFIYIKVLIIIYAYRIIRTVSKPSSVVLHMSEHHLRVLCKVGIYRYPILRHTKVYPVRFHCYFPLPLLKEKDIACDSGSGTALKYGFRKSDRTYKLCPLCKVFSYHRVLLIKGALCGYHRHDAARSRLVYRFCNKIIMYFEVQLIILRIIYLIITKGYVSYDHIKEVVGIGCLFKAFYLYLRTGIKQLCYPSADTVKLHSVKPAV